jgi:Flp pilus assembly protein TadG
MLPLLMLVFGIIQYGIYFYSAQTGASVAERAVRKLSVGDCQDPGDLQSFIASRLGSASTGPVTVSHSYEAEDGSPSAAPVRGGTVNLTFSYQTLNLHFPFLPFLSDSSITKNVDARQEDDTEDSACA